MSSLLAASVLLVGASSFLDFLLLTALAGGVLSLIYIAAFLILKHSAHVIRPQQHRFRRVKRGIYPA